MTDLSGKYLGKEMAWEEMVKLFPGLWVFVTDYKIDGDIVKGVIAGVYTDEESDDFYIECLDKGMDVRCERTTEVPDSFFLGGY